MTDTLSNIGIMAGRFVELSIVLKATLVAAIGLATVALAPGMRASRRHLMLAGTFVVLLALPAAAMLTPPVDIAVRSSLVAPRAFTPPLSPLATVDLSGTALPPARARIPNDIGRSRGVPSPIALFRGVWVLGVLLCLLPVLTITWQLQMLRRSSVPWAEGRVRAARLARAAGVRRPIDVLLNATVDAPIIVGLWRPVILVPRAATQWNDDDLERVLRHEIEHMRRGDWPMLLLARVTCAVYWFHPLVWIAWRRLHLEAERACDDEVTTDADRHEYAQQLLTFARQTSPHRARAVPAITGSGDLTRRVRAILDDRQSRGRAGVVSSLLVLLAVLAVVAGLSPLRAVSVDAVVEPGRRAPQEPRPASFEVASVRQNTTGEGATSLQFPGNARLLATNVPLQMLIVRAYGIPAVLERFLLIGGATATRIPCTRNCSSTEEILTARFDVNAATPNGAPATTDTLMAMLRTLLAERFNLRVRVERREIPVYALTLDRPGQLGPKLRRSSQDCRAWSEARAAARKEATQTGQPSAAPLEPRSATGAALCTGQMFNFGQPDGLGIRGAGSLADLVGRIQELDRPIVDRTGLTGNFEWELIKAVRLEDGRFLPPDAAPLDVALREQLGLRAEPQTLPFQVVVVESVTMPSSN